MFFRLPLEFLFWVSLHFSGNPVKPGWSPVHFFLVNLVRLDIWSVLKFVYCWTPMIPLVKSSSSYSLITFVDYTKLIFFGFVIRANLNSQTPVLNYNNTRFSSFFTLNHLIEPEGLLMLFLLYYSQHSHIYTDKIIIIKSVFNLIINKLW